MPQPATTTTPDLTLPGAVDEALDKAGQKACKNLYDAMQLVDPEEFYRDFETALEDVLDRWHALRSGNPGRNPLAAEETAGQETLAEAFERDPQKLMDWLDSGDQPEDPVEAAIVALRVSDQHLDRVTADAFEELARRIPQKVAAKDPKMTADQAMRTQVLNSLKWHNIMLEEAYQMTNSELKAHHGIGSGSVEWIREQCRMAAQSGAS